MTGDGKAGRSPATWAGMWSGAFVEPWEWRRRKKLEELRRRIERGMKKIERDRI